jgi:hypothetical protein
MARRPLPVSLGIGILSIGVLVGCATGAGSVPTDDEPPDAASPSASSEVNAGWLEAGRGIAVVTLGSSSCVPVAADSSLAGTTLSVDLVDVTDDPCTRDMVPRATYVALPSGVDPTKDLDIVVTGAVTGATSLAGLGVLPAPVAEFAPSAGWVAGDLAAILTWGSSGCRPQLEAVTSSDGGATVTFAEPPADEVCTMDLAPRVTLADLTGIVGDGSVELTLSGGTVASDGPIPVLGNA